MRFSDDVVATDIVHTLERFIESAGIIEQLSGRLAIVEEDHFRLRPALGN